MQSIKYNNKILLLTVLLLASTIVFFGLKNQKVRVSEKKTNINIGGIVPHHDTANVIIDSFFQKFKTEEVIDVIILAPNHYEKGLSNVLSTQNIYPELVQENLVTIDQGAVNADHSVSVPTSFIKKYLPNANIIPIVFKKETLQTTLKQIADNLSKHIKNKKNIIICSVDFSHNLFPKEAEKRDEITLKAIYSFDYQKIMTFSSEYVDSPQSLVTLLMIMENLNVKDFTLLDHSNSAKILGPTITNTTSYFTILFNSTPPQKPAIVRNEYVPEPLSLDKIFTSDHSWTATISGTTTLIATGDVIPARAVNYQTVTKKDFKWPYLNTALFLKSADITLINLESPLLKNCPLTQTGMVFCGDERNVEGLVFAGVDVANLSNNHSENYGKVGLDYTKSLLTNNGIVFSSADDLAIKTVAGAGFGFLGYNALNPIDKEKISLDIKTAKEKVDVLIVSYHWGAEYQSQPSQNEINLAHLSIDNGADLVVGNHPHWVQPPEIYKGKLIVYAHGNFVFDQMWSEKTKEGIVGEYSFYKNRLIDAEFFPVYIKDYGQPQFSDDSSKKRILTELRLESGKLLDKISQF